MRPAPLSILLLVLIAIALPARGQTSDDARFREVEAGFEDLSDRAVSTRIRPVDMRTPTGFERVYEVVGSGGLYARRAGAVTAVFDRSLYAGNATALIPAGTVFYIGSLPVDLHRPGLLSPRVAVAAPASSLVRADVSVDSRAIERVDDASPLQRVDLRVRPGDGVPSRPVTDPRASIWSSESYRQRRIGELLRSVAWNVREIEAAEASEPAEGRRR
jgi:hypothetical protein